MNTIPTRDELVGYLEGDLPEERREQITRMLDAKDDLGISLHADLSELRARLTEMPGSDIPEDKFQTMLQHFSAGLQHNGECSTGEVWELKEPYQNSVLVLFNDGKFAKIVPISNDTEQASPRDLIINQSTISFTPYLLQHSLSFWTRLENLSSYKTSVPAELLEAAKRADRGMFTHLPMGVTRGIIHEDIEIEHYHEELRELQRLTFEPLTVPIHEIFSMESSIRTQVPGINIKTLVLRLPTRHEYGIAADSSESAMRDLQFWEKEREGEEQSKVQILRRNNLEARLSVVEGHLFLIVERYDEQVNTVNNVTLTQGNNQLRSTEEQLEFDWTNRLHFHIIIPPETQLQGKWLVRIHLNNEPVEAEVEFTGDPGN